MEEQIDFLSELFPDLNRSVIGYSLEKNSIDIACLLLLDHDSSNDDDLLKLESMFTDIHYSIIQHCLQKSQSLEAAVDLLLKHNPDPQQKEISRIIMPKGDHDPAYFSSELNEALSNIKPLQLLFPQFDQTSIISTINNCKGDLNQAALVLADILPEVHVRDKYTLEIRTLLELFPHELESSLIARLNRLKNLEVFLFCLTI
jgi:hypothetical protein